MEEKKEDMEDMEEMEKMEDILWIKLKTQGQIPVGQRVAAVRC